MVNKASAAGLRSIRYIGEDTNGYIDSPHFNNTAGGYAEAESMTQVENFGLTQPTPTLVTTQGNDAAGFTYIFKATENPSGELTADVLDNLLIAESTGNSAFTLGNNIDGVLINPDYLSTKNYWFVVNREAKAGTVAEYGNAGFLVDFVRVQLSPLYDEKGFQDKEQMRLQVTALPSGKTPYGELIANSGGTDYGSANTASGLMNNFVPYELTLGVFKGNGVATTATTPSAAVDAANTDAFLLTSGGTFSTLTYVVGAPSAGEFSFTGTTITFGDTHAAGDRVFIIRRL